MFLFELEGNNIVPITKLFLLLILFLLSTNDMIISLSVAVPF